MGDGSAIAIYVVMAVSLIALGLQRAATPESYFMIFLFFITFFSVVGIFVAIAVTKSRDWRFWVMWLVYFFLMLVLSPRITPNLHRGDRVSRFFKRGWAGTKYVGDRIVRSPMTVGERFHSLALAWTPSLSAEAWISKELTRMHQVATKADHYAQSDLQAFIDNNMDTVRQAERMRNMNWDYK